MSFLQGLRGLVLGETWALPIGVAAAVIAAVVVRELSGSEGWWEHSGGVVLMVGLVVALVVSLRGSD